jgi:hypothetical protein
VRGHTKKMCRRISYLLLPYLPGHDLALPLVLIDIATTTLLSKMAIRQRRTYRWRAISRSLTKRDIARLIVRSVISQKKSTWLDSRLLSPHGQLSYGIPHRNQKASDVTDMFRISDATRVACYAVFMYLLPSLRIHFRSIFPLDHDARLVFNFSTRTPAASRQVVKDISLERIPNHQPL